MAYIAKLQTGLPTTENVSAFVDVSYDQKRWTSIGRFAANRLGEILASVPEGAYTRMVVRTYQPAREYNPVIFSPGDHDATVELTLGLPITRPDAETAATATTYTKAEVDAKIAAASGTPGPLSTYVVGTV